MNEQIEKLTRILTMSREGKAVRYNAGRSRTPRRSNNGDYRSTSHKFDPSYGLRPTGTCGMIDSVAFDSSPFGGELDLHA